MAKMTKRIYYDNPGAHEFDSIVEESIPASGGSPPALVLGESAFYPTSGGQIHDLGYLTIGEANRETNRLRVTDVADAEDGRVIHYLEASAKAPVVGTEVHGVIDRERRRDHMQQHSGQHILSAAFIELYQIPTVSFHMAEEYCSIDLTTSALTANQIERAEKRANEIIFENRRVHIRYVTRAEAEKLGLRKLPPADRDELRLIEVADYDLSACGGTHVGATGQIGSILLRKTEKVRQGTRVEFVCGDRAVRIARCDFNTLSESASLFSAKLSDVPEQIRKNAEENRALRKEKDEALEELAQSIAQIELGSQPETEGRLVIIRLFTDRDVNFAKLFAQKLTRGATPAVALVGSAMQPSGIVFAQTSVPAGGTPSPSDMGALLKQVLASVGGRGGGSRDFAQGGVPAGANVEQILRRAADTIKA